MEQEGKGSVYDTIDVPFVDKFIKKIVEAGGKVITEKRTVPRVGHMAYCADTEGNVFGIMQEDPSAHEPRKRMISPTSNSHSLLTNVLKKTVFVWSLSSGVKEPYESRIH